MQAVLKKPKPAYSVAPADKAFAIQTDGKNLRSPAGRDFIVPTRKLADAILVEWQGQSNKIDPATMPFTQLAATTIDITSEGRDKITEQLLAYTGSELLCHRAEEPPELVKLQHDTWQPTLDWCEQNFDDAIWKTGAGIMPIKQPEETYEAMRNAIDRYDVFALTGLRQAADVSGSLVLSLALAEKYLTADEVFAAAELDTTFQMQKWGEDPATVNKRENTRKELAACEKWFELSSRA